MVENIPVGIWLPLALMLWGYLIVGFIHRVLEARRTLTLVISTATGNVIVTVMANQWRALTDDQRGEFIAAWTGHRRR